MKKTLQIPSEIKAITDAIVIEKNIISIVEFADYSTIYIEDLELFNNLSDVFLLKSGMIVTINSKNYQVLGVVNSLQKSFNISAIGIIATKWNLALNYEFGSRQEINSILLEQSNNDLKFKKFPLIWLFTPIEKKTGTTAIDFESELILSFIFNSNSTDKYTKRLDGNIKTVINPLLDLFLLYLKSSDFNYMFEFLGQNKPIDIKSNNYYFYGTTDKKNSVLNTPTDAIEVVLNLKFKKQY